MNKGETLEEALAKANSAQDIQEVIREFFPIKDSFTEQETTLMPSKSDIKTEKTPDGSEKEST